MKKFSFLAAVALASTAASADPKNDSEIIQAVHTANVGEIGAGQLARERAASQAVKDFAVMMVQDHEKMDQSGKDVAAKLKIDPKDSDTSRSLKSAGEKELASLKKLSGAAFDKAYVDAQVRDHEDVLNMIDGKLLPKANEIELKNLLTDARPGIKMHLDHAKALQATLSSTH